MTFYRNVTNKTENFHRNGAKIGCQANAEGIGDEILQIFQCFNGRQLLRMKKKQAPRLLVLSLSRRPNYLQGAPCFRTDVMARWKITAKALYIYWSNHCFW